jgi:PadR family transcriptional regulator, regulatory protein PadR
MSSEIRTRCTPYGRRHVPRSHRRVMLVLLSGARELSGYPISRAAMVGSGTVYIILARLEQLGWVASEWQDPNPLPPGWGRRRFYRLTPFGRERVLDLLGLKDGSDGLTG